MPRCRDASGKMSILFLCRFDVSIVNVCVSSTNLPNDLGGECLRRYICTKWFLRQRSRSVFKLRRQLAFRFRRPFIPFGLVFDGVLYLFNK